MDFCVISCVNPIPSVTARRYVTSLFEHSNVNVQFILTREQIF